MGIFSKLAFWKKRNDFGDLGKDLGLDKDIGMNSSGFNPDLGMGLETATPEKYPSYQTPGGMHAPAFNQQSFQPSYPPQPQASQFSPAYNDSNYITSKNLEVISSKLDALRASLDSINQRLANIESIARGEQDDKRRRYY